MNNKVHKRIVVLFDRIVFISMMSYVNVKQYDCQHIYMIYALCRNSLSQVSAFKLLLLCFPSSNNLLDFVYLTLKKTANF